MYSEHINLAPFSPRQDRQRPGRRLGLRVILKFLFLLLLIYFIVAFILSSKVIFSQVTFGRALGKLPVVSQIRDIFIDQDSVLAKNDGRLNFVILGIGGAGHEGSLLADSIIIFSLDVITKQSAIVSIPRDLLVKIPDNGYQRINHASAYGDVNDYPGGGAALTAKTIEENFGIPIHYWLRLNFSAFKKIIDHLGGIDVYIERSFTDPSYPTSDFGVEVLSFERGWRHFDGETALKFARSRHGDNGEGSDFARSRRQQKIIMAVKDKILSLKMISKPKQIYNIISQLGDNIDTNIQAWNLPEVLAAFSGVDFQKNSHYVVDDSPGGLLKPLILDNGAFVLVPKSGDLEEIKDFMANLFVIQDISDKKLEIVIANGTNTEGLAGYIGSLLSSWGFQIGQLVNSPVQDFEKTVIYDLSGGNEEEALKILKARLNANASSNIPDYFSYLFKPEPDGSEKPSSAHFFIIVGADQKKSIEALEEWRLKQSLPQTLEEGESPGESLGDEGLVTN